jgi:hypothetical protein
MGGIWAISCTEKTHENTAIAEMAETREIRRYIATWHIISPGLKK